MIWKIAIETTIGPKNAITHNSFMEGKMCETLFREHHLTDQCLLSLSHAQPRRFDSFLNTEHLFKSWLKTESPHFKATASRF